MIVRELIARLGFDTDLRGVKKWEQGAQQVQNRANGLATQLRGMFAAAAGIHAIKSVIAVGDAMQSLEARIKLLPQTVGEAGASFDEVARRASAARTSIEAYGTLYVRLAQSLRAFKYTQEDTLAVTDAISAALVVSGAEASEAASVTLQLSQAFNKGKLDGDEFRAFMEGLSADFKDKLAAEIGTTADKLFELSKSGELTARKLADAFKKMAPEIQKQLLQMPMTVGQAVTIVGNKFGLFIAKLNRESQFISNIAGIIISAMDLVSDSVDRLSKQFNGIGNIVRFVGEAIVSWYGIKAVGAIMAMDKAAWLLNGRMALMFGAFLLGVAIIDDLIVWFRGGNSVLGELVGNTDEARNAFVGFTSVIAGIIGLLYTYRAISATIVAVKTAWAAITYGLAAAQAVWNAAMFANPIGLIIAGIVALIAAGALLILNWDKVKTWFTDFFGGLGKQVKDLIGWFGKLLGMTGGSIDVNAGAAGGVKPAQMGGVGKAGSPVVNNSQTTNVALTVPPGTPQEQQNFLSRAAAKLFGSDGSPSSAEMGVYAP